MTPYDLLVATRRLIADVNRNPIVGLLAQADVLRHLEAVRVLLYAQPGVADDHAEDLRDALRMKPAQVCDREAPLQSLDMVGELSARSVRVLRDASKRERASVCPTALTAGAERAVLNALARRKLIEHDGAAWRITPAGRAVVADADRIGV